MFHMKSDFLPTYSEKQKSDEKQFSSLFEKSLLPHSVVHFRGKDEFNFNSRGVNLQLLFSAEVYSSYTIKEKINLFSYRDYNLFLKTSL